MNLLFWRKPKPAKLAPAQAPLKMAHPEIAAKYIAAATPAISIPYTVSTPALPSAAPKEIQTMSVKSILGDVGTFLSKYIVKPVEKVVVDATGVAEVAEPFVDKVFPGLSPLYDGTVAAVAAAETAAIAAGQQNGTGAQKMAMVAASIEGSFNAYWTSIGHTTPPLVTDIENWVNGVVASLNAIPTPTPTPVV